jgi:hypothetical protein
MNTENMIVTVVLIAMMIFSLIYAIYDKNAVAPAIIICTIPPMLWGLALMADS